MKLVAVLALLCCLTISVLASPVPQQVESKVAVEPAKETGRQAAPAAPAAPVPAASDEDDDDDDDDDDIDLGIESADDDDDEEEEDEEDDDYFEKFIEDIFSAEDEEDDDTAVEAPVVPASPVVQQAAPAPAIPAAVQSDLNAVAAEEAADEASSEAASETDTSTYEDEETGDVVPEGQAASTIQEASVEIVEPIGNQVVPNQIPAAVAPAASSEDDDDDEDDDDLDITGDVVDDDDDDEEEDDEDDDEDDEDDEDVIGDIADARQAREFKGKTKKHTNTRKLVRKSATQSSRMLDSQSTGDVSAIYVSKYNRFVDNILGHINKILKANYDPVTVKLTNPYTNSKSSKSKSKKKNSKRKINKNGSRKSAPESATTISDHHIGLKTGDTFRLSTITKKMDEHLEDSTSPIASTTPILQTTTPSAIKSNKRVTVITTVHPVLTSRSASSISSGNKKKNKTKNKIRTKITTTTRRPITSSTNANKNKINKNKPKAKATLYGLASLQRSGDVSVNMMSDHTTIKTKFSLGPLMLKVEKEFGRAAKKELRSATATTAEMSGKLSLRVLHGGAATLHSIRVLQPKQVRVESADDHDRTREFVWKRSSHIAHLVSQKLSSATRSMLRPPPVQVPAV